MEGGHNGFSGMFFGSHNSLTYQTAQYARQRFVSVSAAVPNMLCTSYLSNKDTEYTTVFISFEIKVSFEWQNKNYVFII
jgi:hypothetical protein